MRDAWSPAQYEKFRQERAQPLVDLISMIQSRPGMSCIDLGCGTGEWTQYLHYTLANTSTLGIDTSDAMLAETHKHISEGIAYQNADIHHFDYPPTFDLIFSNSTLQWVPRHDRLIVRLVRALRPGGQLAIQMPKNGDHPAQREAEFLAGENPYREFPASATTENVMPVERYASLLYHLGMQDVTVRLQVYTHFLESKHHVLEWMKGAILTHYAAALPPRVYDYFLVDYKDRLLDVLPDERPFLFTMKRLFLHAVKPMATP